MHVGRAGSNLHGADVHRIGADGCTSSAVLRDVSKLPAFEAGPLLDIYSRLGAFGGIVRAAAVEALQLMLRSGTCCWRRSLSLSRLELAACSSLRSASLLPRVVPLHPVSHCQDSS